MADELIVKVATRCGFKVGHDFTPVQTSFRQSSNLNLTNIFASYVKLFYHGLNMIENR